MKNLVKMLLILLLALPVVADESSTIVGKILKDILQNHHFRKLPMDDKLSKKAFDEYIKAVDYSKHFLYESEVKDLKKKYQKKFDDQIQSGKITIASDTLGIVQKRVDLLQKWREEFFKKKFDYKVKETIELEAKKRDFASNEKELKNRWRKIFKQSVLSRYLITKDEQENINKKKDEKPVISKKDLRERMDKAKNPAVDVGFKNAKKLEEGKSLTGNVKKLSEKEMWDKAYADINKKYKRIFTRLKKDRLSDHIKKFYNSVTSIYDPHTSYYPPKEKEDFDIDISGSLEGIGAVLSEDGSYIKVVEIVAGGAAWRQKDLEVGDLILSVAQGEKEPISIVDMRVDDAVRYIRGKKGTIVKLTVKKASGLTKVIPIVRDIVRVGESYAKSSVLTVDKLGTKIGYIKLPKFYRDFEKKSRTCTDDVKKELERLKTFNVDGVILDLRNNGGGALDDAVKMSGLFIDKGPIVQVKNSAGQVEVLSDEDPSITYGGPLIVLINRYSASASEILAGALKDYGRAVVVGGEHTHGKGTVQAVYDLNNAVQIFKLFGPKLGALKITMQKFYRVNGHSTQFKGIKPDIVLPDPYGYTKNREKDLENALPWDSISKLSYNEWKNSKFSLSVLKSRSKKRVKRDERFQKITSLVDYLIDRRDDTQFSLNLTDAIKEDEENRKITEKLKYDKVNKSIKISHFEESLESAINIKNKKSKNWQREFKQRKEEWIKTIQEDPTLEETLYIITDMINSTKGKKLGML